ncbi:cell division protein ZapD [Colwellia sp. 1_MG-2023]|uniref:cell division protein ZapD n=1 Tax=Colwellia sp. 1_MG-2023 TaxID=3062649 RepID=UPI0026E295B0|nr:cell division protein ZapD [Colwellia sp. 1_MG-2023]MDO6444667.1 cell division protein ZapD [Colwellia sp. 1_MG-2023]
MSSVLYEHPLNERIRNYLKLEQLYSQAKNCLHCDIDLSHQIFFSSFFAILDTLERNDIRGELIKDLEKLEQNLVIWSRAPNVDNSILEDNLKQSVSLLCQLKTPSPQWLQLKEDKFLSTLKQRYAMQGGSCSFDLPQLTFWLNRPHTDIEKDIHHWLSLLTQVFSSLALILKFIRQRTSFENVQCQNGFYQDNGEGILLLRIKLAQDANYYPTVSGNKFRYSIRFMLPCNETGRKYYDQQVQFQLARC